MHGSLLCSDNKVESLILYISDTFSNEVINDSNIVQLIISNKIPQKPDDKDDKHESYCLLYENDREKAMRETVGLKHLHAPNPDQVRATSLLFFINFFFISFICFIRFNSS